MSVSVKDIQIPIKDDDDEDEREHHQYLVDGILALPEQQHNSRRGIVIFAHGSGSGRHSPRNQYVASTLNESGIATLLVDLLTEEEQKIDEKTREYRFNIKLLASRLIANIEKSQENKNSKNS